MITPKYVIYYVCMIIILFIYFLNFDKAVTAYKSQIESQKNSSGAASVHDSRCSFQLFLQIILDGLFEQLVVKIEITKLVN